MAITYLLVPLIFRRQIIWKGLAKWQPYLFGIGVGGISLFMMGAGTLGVPRRHWDITFTDAALSLELPGTAFLMMGLNGIFALLAATGGLVFVVIVVGSVLFGERRTEAVAKANPVVFDGGAAIAHYGSEEHLKVPGTIVLVAIFFTAFVLYYFVNWKFLSQVWPLS
jgi:cytochrome c oxidase subunit 1